jgi:hypothetical protein
MLKVHARSVMTLLRHIRDWINKISATGRQIQFYFMLNRPINEKMLAERLQAAIIAAMNLTLQKRSADFSNETTTGFFWFGFYYFFEK